MKRKGQEYLVACYSRSLRDHELNYSPTEVEALAIKWALWKAKTLIGFKHVDVYTDHQALKYMIGPMGDFSKQQRTRIARWRAELLEYDITVHYKRGLDNVVADCLSRATVPSSVQEEKEIDYNPIHIRYGDFLQNEPVTFPTPAIHSQLINSGGDEVLPVDLNRKETKAIRINTQGEITYPDGTAEDEKLQEPFSQEHKVKESTTEATKQILATSTWRENMKSVLKRMSEQIDKVEHPIPTSTFKDLWDTILNDKDLFNSAKSPTWTSTNELQHEVLEDGEETFDDQNSVMEKREDIQVSPSTKDDLDWKDSSSIHDDEDSKEDVPRTPFTIHHEEKKLDQAQDHISDKTLSNRFQSTFEGKVSKTFLSPFAQDFRQMQLQ